MPLTVESLSFGYSPERIILNNVSLKIEDGEFLSIVGPNGCGKTTLVKCLNRIHTPAKGKISFDEMDVLRARPREIAEKIGYVPQCAGECMSGTVTDYILLGRRRFLKWKVDRRDLAAVMSAMERLEITELANRNFSELSGGQKQKVLIARAIAQEPDLFLFDEPTSSLDIKNQLEIMSLAQGIVRDLHKTVIVVVHDLNMARHYSDRVALMSEGKIVACGLPTEILTPKNIKRIYGVDVKITADRLIDPFAFP